MRLKRYLTWTGQQIDRLARNAAFSTAVILAVALAVRLAYLTVIVGLNSPPTYDGIGYDMLAVHIEPRSFKVTPVLTPPPAPSPRPLACGGGRGEGIPPLPRAKRWGEGAGGEGQKLLPTAQREMAYPMAVTRARRDSITCDQWPDLLFLALAFAGMALTRKGWREQFPL
jgi:hypothetical protein